MKNPIKSYFLFFSLSPIFFNLIIIFLALLAAAIASMFVSSDSLEQIFSGRRIIIFLGVIIANIILIYIVAGIWITRPARSCFNELFAVLVTKDNRKIIVKYPVWVRGKKYVINNPDSDLYYGKTYKVWTTIKGKYKNSTATIPVKLVFILSEEFQGRAKLELEIFEALSKDQEGTELSIDEYVVDTFQKLSDRNQEGINQAIAEYAQMTISAPELLNRIFGVLIFPERLFSNVVDVKICLEDPTFSSCKGMACGGNGR